MPDVKNQDQQQPPQSSIVDQEGDRERRIDSMRPLADEDCGCDPEQKEKERES